MTSHYNSIHCKCCQCSVLQWIQWRYNQYTSMCLSLSSREHVSISHTTFSHMPRTIFSHVMRGRQMIPLIRIGRHCSLIWELLLGTHLLSRSLWLTTYQLKNKMIAPKFNVFSSAMQLRGGLISQYSSLYKCWLLNESFGHFCTTSNCK